VDIGKAAASKILWSGRYLLDYYASGENFTISPLFPTKEFTLPYSPAGILPPDFIFCIVSVTTFFRGVGAMSRFVMVSFMFMGWTFYEMSGGAGFAPPERPIPVAIAKLEPLSDQHVTAASLITKPVIQPMQNPTLQLHSTDSVTTLPTRPDADPELRSRVVLMQIAAVGETSFDFGANVNTAPTDSSTVQLASLSGGLASLAGNKVISDTAVDPIIPLGPAIDLRHVTASRVNMRDGPGTLYPVVNKLNRDAAVEVLDDSGTGWLRLRVVDGEQIGWIAASLISKKRP